MNTIHRIKRSDNTHLDVCYNNLFLSTWNAAVSRIQAGRRSREARVHDPFVSPFSHPAQIVRRTLSQLQGINSRRSVMRMITNDSWPTEDRFGRLRTRLERRLKRPRRDGVRMNVAARLTTAAAAVACADRLPRLATEKPRDQGECTQDRALGPIEGVGGA